MNERRYGSDVECEVAALCEIGSQRLSTPCIELPSQHWESDVEIGSGADTVLRCRPVSQRRLYIGVFLGWHSYANVLSACVSKFSSSSI